MKKQSVGRRLKDKLRTIKNRVKPKKGNRGGSSISGKGMTQMGGVIKAFNFRATSPPKGGFVLSGPKNVRRCSRRGSVSRMKMSFHQVL